MSIPYINLEITAQVGSLSRKRDTNSSLPKGITCQPFRFHSLNPFECTVMQIERTLVNDCSRVSEVS